MEIWDLGRGSGGLGRVSGIGEEFLGFGQEVLGVFRIWEGFLGFWQFLRFGQVFGDFLGFGQGFWDLYRNFGIRTGILGRYLGIFWDVPDSQVEGEQWGGFGAGESLPGHHLQQLPVNLPLLFPHGLRGKITEKIPLKSLEFADPEGFPPNSGIWWDPMKATLRKTPKIGI